MRDNARMNLTSRLAVDTHQAARMLSVSPRTIQNYIRAKMLPVRKIGRRTVIPVWALEDFLLTDHKLPAGGVPDANGESP